jgi:CRP-like cAMP-binding protein
MKKITVKKGTILQTPNSSPTQIYEVHKGLLRSYYIDQKGKEHIFMFAPEGWVIAESALKEQNSELFIDALEDSILFVQEKSISAITNSTIIEHNEILHKLIRRMAVLQKRIIMLMSSTAIERYQHFIETYPQIVQRVPQRMIASYLGITPEALSKVKRARIKKK